MEFETENFEGKEPEELRLLLKDIARGLGLRMPQGWGFTFLMFEYGESGNFLYASSEERKAMIEVTREFIKSKSND